MSGSVPVRVAFRVEGDMWNAYLASGESMQGARLLGSILMALVANNQDRKAAFMDLMQDVLAELVREAVGQEPSFSVGPAPEHERSGHG